MKALARLLAFVIAVAFAPLAAAQVAVDFESFDLMGQMFLDVPEILVFPNVGGSCVTVTLQGHDDVRIYDLVSPSSSKGTLGPARRGFREHHASTLRPPVRSVGCLSNP